MGPPGLFLAQQVAVGAHLGHDEGAIGHGRGVAPPLLLAVEAQGNCEDGDEQKEDEHQQDHCQHYPLHLLLQWVYVIP